MNTPPLHTHKIYHPTPHNELFMSALEYLINNFQKIAIAVNLSSTNSSYDSLCFCSVHYFISIEQQQQIHLHHQPLHKIINNA
jgi:hypothetical protein